MNIIDELDHEEMVRIESKRSLPKFSPGDTLCVKTIITEGDKSRIQAYEGVCIARSGRGINKNFTVRKISYGEGMNRLFPLYSPMIQDITVIRRGKVRRSKLYYLQDLRGKAARIKENTGKRAKALNEEVRRAALPEKEMSK
ncbi:50S ribosomal protein L19 [Candidatus Liberibacter asiaticus]|uniref:Large ribosomal subunit protein bL19 n=2 Tax=Liberibacter asiaticus TaxID=34021 RepID=C6XFN5_LIBAP|nr:50S ribosomal protein L19 [Candidatus Liberibacter asiaticus]ACT57188.1 50S ribosomal protein L19 [Candidatus Liberibacter asiaticus str. psy62]AGH16849.1 50S ribosomal protein L19 [Candidatus Liberibacter asiaticus str. gxpsy]ALK07207.1 50S ribosomal protein L19 [Candidatus Liberibacter asiaticus]ASK52688.1 50S ribosomal protein L19 [Candidatus Liberibacter asiaticus]AWL14013.1 50S ribosomal protein L19 [Candidatus Liberibacter asiaticus]